MDENMRILERAVATGEPGARAALRRAKNRAGEGEALYTRDLAAEALGEREHGSFAAHAAGVRAVLKAHKLEKLGIARARVITESYSMCSTIRLRIELVIDFDSKAVEAAIARDIGAQDREQLAARISEVLGVRVDHDGAHLEVWQRDAEPDDPGADYGTRRAGPRIRPEDQERFLAAFVKVEERKAQKREERAA